MSRHASHAFHFAGYCRVHGRLPGSVLLLPFLLFLPGCLATISSIFIAPEVTVEEECAVLLRGTIEGAEAGLAGIALQVPSSFKHTGGYYLTRYGRRPLRRVRLAEERYQPEEGSMVLVFGDSVRYIGERSGWAACIIMFVPIEAGTFTVKAIAGGATGRGGAGSWRSSDPPKLYRFDELDDTRLTAACVVRENEPNGTTCIAFDGERSYVAMPPGSELSPVTDSAMTVEWLFRTTATDVVMLSDRQDDVDGPHRLESGIDELGQLYLTVSDGYQMMTARSLLPVSDGAWHHVAITMTGTPGLARMFLDGVCRDSIDFLSKNLIPSRRFFLGSRGGRTRFYRGMMEEFRMWRRIRSDQEIRFFRDVALSGHEEDLLILYSFDLTSQDSIYNGTPRGTLHAVAYNHPKIVASNAPIQLEFSTFRAELLEDSVLLSWETFDEKDICCFELEKRLESGHYHILERIDAVRSPQNYHRYIYRDPKHPSEASYYRLRQIHADGTVRFSPEAVIGLAEVHDFTLDQNNPEPFGTGSPAGVDTTVITYHLQEDTRLVLTVHDILGRVVVELVNGRQKAGTYSVVFDGRDLPSGLYFFKLRSDSGAETRKMSLEK